MHLFSISNEYFINNMPYKEQKGYWGETYTKVNEYDRSDIDHNIIMLYIFIGRTYHYNKQWDWGSYTHYINVLQGKFCCAGVIMCYCTKHFQHA